MQVLLLIVPLITVILLNLPFKQGFRKLSIYAAVAIAAWQVLLCVIPSFFGLVPGDFWSCVSCSSRFHALNLSIDPLSLIMLVTIALVALSALLTGWDTIRDANKKFDFVNLVLIALAGMNGMVMARDVFTLYVFIEITAVCSFILIALHKDKAALEGAFKYIIMSAVATIMMLSAIALLMMLAGDTSFESLSALFKAGQPSFFVLLSVGLFIGGLLIKGGVVPFHGWLPDAYSSAPAGASVLLAGIVTKTTGIYTLIRIVVAIFGFTAQVKGILLFTGTLSMFVGALAALNQKDLKRMLAYSSISQVGYIVTGLGAGNALGLCGAVFHLFNHSIFKSQLFVNAAAVEEMAGTRDMDKLGGIAEKMPVTGTTSLVAFLSAAGIPPLSGFWSKLIIIIALWTAGFKVYAILAVLAGVITLAYFLSMQRRIFFGKLAEEFMNLKEARGALLAPAVLFTLITIGAGLFFPFVLNYFILPLKALVG